LQEFDVIVIGGGMVGLAFAIELSQKKNYSNIQKIQKFFKRKIYEKNYSLLN